MCDGEQAVNVATLPGIIQASYAMPDAHWGYGFPIGVVVQGATPATDLGLVSAGAELRFANGWSLGAKFDGEFANRAQTYAGSATARYT
jgi:tRNA-splicing ligase RtcB